MRLVVVGGVAGGMSAAARARRLDESAEIIVLERGDHVSFANCGLPYFVGGEITEESKLLVQTPDSLAAQLNLDVRVRHDVVGVDAEAKTVTVDVGGEQRMISYDALVLSPGAAASRPPIAGIDSPRVRTLRTVGDAVALRDAVVEGARTAVVLGGGFIGIEAAEAFALRGLHTTLVELAPHILPPLETEMASLAAAELRRLGIEVCEGIAATEIVPGPAQDTVVLSDGSRLDAHVIVLSVGVRPDTSAFEAAGVACDRGAIMVDAHGRTNLPDVYAVGDAVVSVDAVTGARRPVALAGPANRAGRLVADAIFRPGQARPMPALLGTAVVRVGELTVAMTGASSSALDAAGISHHTIHIHPNNHAGYFPGASTIDLLVHFRTGDGLLLGAQAVGKDGVEKRIDVIGTAIRGGLVVADLMDLDLSYAPPYGSAKDPVTMAGMAGDNLLNGTLRLWYADDIESVMADQLVLDVRSEAEFRTGHVPGALQVAHTDVRDRLDEIRAAAADRPVAVMCAAGVRSYLAHRVLSQEGFDSSMLSGGMRTLTATLGSRASALLTR
jgi:NADPH-dependent 2,4-dienoyl-CoA reductase/sulfur reductase-like enzyme/rhodanese-related sulfurtransferase